MKSLILLLYGCGYQFGPKQIPLELDPSSGQYLELIGIHSHSFSGRDQKGSSALEHSYCPAVQKNADSDGHSRGKTVILILKDWSKKLRKLLMENGKMANEGGIEANPLIKKGQ